MDPGFVGRDPGALAQHYLANATDLLDKGRREKAAELFWGAVAAAIRAVAFRSGRDFTTHNGLRMFLYQLAKDAGDDPGSRRSDSPSGRGAA